MLSTKHVKPVAVVMLVELNEQLIVEKIMAVIEK